MNPIYRFFLFTDDNVYHSNANTTGKYVDPSTGELLDNSAWTATGYLNVTPGSVLMGDPIRQTAFYDINRNYISGTQGLGNGAAQVIYINVPANAYYIRTSIRHANAGELDNFYIYAGKQAAPTYKDDLAKDYEQETNQRFYRAKLSGKLSFIGDDYDYIMSKAFETQYSLLIERSDDWGAHWVKEFGGKFFRTDCTINVDNKKITVQPDPVDEYNDTLAGIENEYNLIPLAPEIERILMRKRPLIQVYIPGDSIVSCFLGGNYWEQDANATTDRNALVNTYYFALANMLKEMKVTANGTPTAINGTYAGRMAVTSGNNYTGTLYPDTQTGYRITVAMQYEPPFFSRVVCNIIRNSDDAVMFTYQAAIGGNTWDNLTFTMNANASSGATGTATVEMATYNIYARYLLDVDTIENGNRTLNTYPLPTDDIVDYNRNYRRAIGYAIDIAYISNNFSTAPTEWGRRDDGTYFEPPYSIYGQKYYPIARSTWRYTSIWFAFHYGDSWIEKTGRKTYWLRDAYPIASVISVLLKQFAPDITHEATAEYSQFLYGDTNPISGQKFWLYLTQKSNILVGDYQQPAQKAPTTLTQIMNMLRDVYKCYWYIEDGKFKIEHVQFFRNGGRYTGSPIVGTDTTAIKVIRNGKPWSFATSEYSFDKVDMPQRFQFKWMDDVTTAFEGEAIDVQSKYVTPGKIEEINISNFTSDVDMMMLNPGNMSSDGFGLFAAVVANALDGDDSGYYPGFGGSTAADGGLSTPTYKVRPELTGNVGYAKGVIYANTAGQYRVVFYNSEGTVISRHAIRNFNAGTTTIDYPFNIPATATAFGYESISGAFTAYTYGIEVPAVHELPFTTLEVNGVEYSLQNGLLAFIFLQPQYWLYDMPARSLRVNGSSASAYSIERKKKQTLSFPMLTDPNPVQLIKTEIGSGQIDKMSINLCSRMSKTTVKYDTE